MSVSILILTLNEAANLPRCLESVSWSDDVVVLDSGSIDGTVEIARSAGARIFERKLDNWAAHLNWAVTSIPFRHPWVYYSDADEVVTPELRDEMLAIAKHHESASVAYRVRYRNFFMGRWIKHCSTYPVWVYRFFRPEKIRWERLVNPVPVIDGPEGRLKNHFLHYSFNKGLSAWFEKHNRYSQQEAEEGCRSQAVGGLRPAHLFSTDGMIRRRALKELSFRLPFRPTLHFCYRYFLRRGFLDGRPGLTFCRMMAIYEYMMVVKMEEIRRRDRGLPI